MSSQIFVISLLIQEDTFFSFYLESHLNPTLAFELRSSKDFLKIQQSLSP